MGTISRGLSGRRTAADVKLPPGQYLTNDFRVLSAGPTPHVALDKREFTIDDGRSAAVELEVISRLAYGDDHS